MPGGPEDQAMRISQEAIYQASSRSGPRPQAVGQDFHEARRVSCLRTQILRHA